MLELAEQLLPLLERGVPVAVATSIDVVGSAPQLVGTSMAVSDDGDVFGEVSGGCVDAAALAGCQRLLAGAEPWVARFGFGEDAAARAGLACGGELDVLLHRVEGAELLPALRAAVAGRLAAAGIITAGPHLGQVIGAAGQAEPAAAGDVATGTVSAVRRALAEQAAVGRSAEIEVLAGDGSIRVLADVRATVRRLVIGGATRVAAELAAAAMRLGYAVTVVEPRPAFARAGRLPDGAAVRCEPVHEYLAGSVVDTSTAVCLLGHDEELDPLALAIALERGAGYVGALGSRATHARRVARLRALDVSGSRIARVRGPIGLDLGASTAAETALSILAEMLAERTGASGDPLVLRSGPIHGSEPDPGRESAAGRTGSGSGPCRRRFVFAGMEDPDVSGG